jgi:hypothetical protein
MMPETNHDYERTMYHAIAWACAGWCLFIFAVGFIIGRLA